MCRLDCITECTSQVSVTVEAAGLAWQFLCWDPRLDGSESSVVTPRLLMALPSKIIVTRRLYTLELIHKKLGSPLSLCYVHWLCFSQHGGDDGLQKWMPQENRSYKWCNAMRLNILNLWWYSKLQFTIARSFKSMITGKCCVWCVCAYVCALYCCDACVYVHMRTVAWLGSLPPGASNHYYKLWYFKSHDIYWIFLYMAQ
jgi:hypothetical protein